MKPIKHLLVIRLSAMGDVAMSVPVLKAFCNQYPDIKITVLTKVFFKPIFSQLPNVDVHIAEVKGNHKGVFGLYRLYKELKSKKIDAVADLHRVLRSTVLKVFFRFGGVQFVRIDKGRAEKKALVNGKAGGFRQLRSTHDRYRQVFVQLGFELEVPKNSVVPTQPMSDKTKQVFREGQQQVIAIAPFAAFKGKMYPLDLMEVVVSKLNASNAYRILLFGGGERELKQLSLWEGAYQNVTNASRILNFQEELSLISHVDLMLAMDSGNGHLAAMYGVPTITLWGVTHPFAGFAPFGQPQENSLLANRKEFPAIPTSIYGNTMPEGYEKAMETIAPETILNRITELTNK